MSASQELLFLSLEDVVAASGADMRLAIDDVERGFQLYEGGQVSQPHKTTFTHDGEVANGFNILPSIVEVEGTNEVFGCKILGSNPNNNGNGIPRAVGLIALYDGDNKKPLAVMDAQVISATRTGAVSALAARHLVPTDTESVGLIGAGVNMKTQLLGVMSELPSLSSVDVFALGKSKDCFVRDMSARTGLSVTGKSSSREAIGDNRFNILCTTKPSRPLIEEGWLPSQGVTIFNISGHATPLETVASMDRLVTDSLDDCTHRGTQSLPKAIEAKMIAADDIEEMADIIRTGDGRRNDDENVFFCPVGLAFEDVIVAWRVYKTALQQKIGQSVTLWSDVNWI